MNSNTFLKPDLLLADILKLVDDERYEWNTKGYYISQIQQCLEELSFDTFFDKRSISFEFPKESLGLAMPEGVFNLRQINIYNGDECNFNNSQIVWPKRNYYTKGSGYIARNTGSNNNDPFYSPSSFPRRDPRMDVATETALNNHYFYNVQNGIIMFSSFCSSFERVLITFNGTGCPIGDIPIVPIFFRQVVKDYVCEVSLRERIAKDTVKWKPIWQIYHQKLNKEEDYGPYKGSWYSAQQRVKDMDSAEFEAYKEFLSRGQW